MTTYETPYGTVDAPTLEAAQKWIAGQKSKAAPQPAAGSSSPAQSSGGDSLWQRLVHGMQGRDTSKAGRFGMGLADAFYGGAQIGARMPMTPPDQPGMAVEMPAGTRDSVDRSVQQREQSYQQGTDLLSPKGKLGTDWMRLLGNAAVPLATAGAGSAVGATGAPASTLGRIGLGAATGAAGGLLAPTPNTQNFAAEKAKQAALGAVTGAGTAGVGSAIGGAIAPRLAPDAAALTQQGVRLTPGRVFAGPSNMGMRAEDRLAGFPILGDFIRNSQRRSIGDFNRATINQALSPIGASLPEKMKGGNEAIKTAGNAISKAYDAVLDRIPTVTQDTQLAQDIGQVAQQAKARPEVWKNFEPIVINDIKPFEKGTISGRDYKMIDSDLAREARGLGSSDDIYKRQLGDRIEELRGAMRNAIRRQYPEEAPNLDAADFSRAMFARVQQAASRRATSDGMFSPNDLLNAVRSQSGGSSRLRPEFGKGDALFQNWAQAAQRLLPSSVPDSGTAGRMMFEHPVQGAMLGLANLAGAAPLSLASRLVQRQRMLPPDPVRDVFEDVASGLSAGTGETSARRRYRPQAPGSP